MKKGWDWVKLGKVLKQDKASAVPVEPSEIYEMVGVYSFGRGLFHKDSQLGMNTSYKVFYKLKESHIVMSQLFGWEGALALSSKEFEGKFVSYQFPTFLIDETLADRDFIGFFLQRKQVWEMLFARGTGMGSRRRMLNPESLLGIEIPLPPLAEQQRIAARLTALKEKMDTVRRLRGEQEKEMQAMRNGIFKQIVSHHKAEVLGEILIPRKEVVSVEPEEKYKQITVKTQHNGLTLRGIILGGEALSTQFRAREGDFIISKIDARNGSMGLVSKDLDESIVTNDFPVFVFSEKCLPKFFDFISNTEYFDQKCIQSSEGTTNRVRLKMDRFFQIEIPLPPITEQIRIIEFLEKTTALKTIQSEQMRGLEGLFPAVLERAFRGEW